MPRFEPKMREQASVLEPIFSQVEASMGFLPNSLRIMAYKPDLARAFAMLAQAVEGSKNKTSSGLRSLVAHMASRSAGCQYCTAHTAHSLHYANAVDDEKIASVWEFETSPLFTDAERIALRFALAAGAVPNGVTDEDFQALRLYYSDEEIVELVAVIAFFGFLNRWNDTFATVLEDAPLGYAQRVLAQSGWNAGKHHPARDAPKTGD